MPTASSTVRGSRTRSTGQARALTVVPSETVFLTAATRGTALRLISSWPALTMSEPQGAYAFTSKYSVCALQFSICIANNLFVACTEADFASMKSVLVGS